MKFPFAPHAAGFIYQIRDPVEFHKPRAWQIGFFVSSASADGSGDSPSGNGEGEGVSSDCQAHINPQAKAIFFFLLCTDTDDFETVIINSACRMRP